MSHSGLPVAGYLPQTDEKVALVNENKKLEELVLRQLDKMKTTPGMDQRFIALGVTQIQLAFMCVNRAVFQPARLEGDLS